MDDGDSTVWLSYSELAARRGIGRRSAVRLAQRRRWPRRGNRATSRSLVPLNEAEPKHDAGDVAGDVVGDDGSDISRIIGGFEAALASLTERAQPAEKRAEQAETRADKAEQARDAQAELTAAQEKLRESEHARLEFWRKSRGARLRAVWKGREG